MVKIKGFSSFIKIGDLGIGLNKALNNIEDAFSNLDSLRKLSIWDNEALVNVNGFQSLSFIENYCAIRRNISLTNLEIFEGPIDNINLLNISGNYSLVDLNSVSSIKQVSTVWITENYSLVDFCGIKNLVAHSAPFHQFVLEYNKVNPSMAEITSLNCQ
jgi:hypothetical protein